MKDKAFFVPNTEPKKYEAAYNAMAKLSNAVIPPTDKRIYSIDFRNKGERWTATVGEQLKGVHEIRDKKSGRIIRVDQLSDPAVVYAIFPGNPYLVITDRGQRAGEPSAFNLPLYAGEPISVTYFKV